MNLNLIDDVTIDAVTGWSGLDSHYERWIENAKYYRTHFHKIKEGYVFIIKAHVLEEISNIKTETPIVKSMVPEHQIE
jgi:hypothetical protein